MLPAPSAPGHSSLGTPNQSGSRDVTPVCPEGNRIRISFSYFCFILSFELECLVNYNLVGVFIFPFLSTANCFTCTGVYMISCGFFLYRFLQNVEYISLCYTVGPGQLFYQHFLFIHSVVSNSLWPHGLQHAGFPVLHYFLDFAETHVHWVSDAIQSSHPLSSPSQPAFNLSQHQGLFQWFGCLQQVAKVLELQFQYQSLQWIFRVDIP